MAIPLEPQADSVAGEESPALGPTTSTDGCDPEPLDPVLAAAKRMVAAINGEGPPVEPVTVCKRADGRYEVLDGHDILQAAKLAGWTKVAVQVVERH